jgi:hypothetical protein
VPSARLSPDQTFGSIRSLSVTREVASFPLSRTPSPPPPRAALERYVVRVIGVYLILLKINWLVKLNRPFIFRELPHIKNHTHDHRKVKFA